MAIGNSHWSNFNDFHSDQLSKASDIGSKSLTLQMNGAPYVVNMDTQLMALAGADYNFKNNALRVRRAPMVV